MTPETADLWHRARQALDTAILLADRDPDEARQAIEKAQLVLRAVQRSAPEPLDTP